MRKRLGVWARSASALGAFLLALLATQNPGLAQVETASSLLADLQMRAENAAGYDRDLFPHWIDADGDGCDTRAEVLIRDSEVATTRNSNCTVQTGRWFSWYDGRTWTDAADVEIDHLVALSEAWASGARSWSTTQRQRFANDLTFRWALNETTSAVNSSKSDDDPAEWLPPRADAVCPYVIRWMKVKYRWSLSIDRNERDALARVLDGDCGDRIIKLPPLAPSDPGGPGAGGGGGGGAAGGGGGSRCDAAYPTVCIPPPPPDLDCSDISFRNFTVMAPDPHRFDGDGNGIGCET